VESAPGRGSSFSISVPRHAAPAAAEPAPRHAVTVLSAGGHVLLVEDQPEVRGVTRVILRNLGFEVLEAESGEHALGIPDRHDGPIDLLLTDVIMPGMNGRELASRFEALRPRAKVIFMSGYTDRIMSEDGLLDPSIHFLRKPFLPEELCELVAKALGRFSPGTAPSPSVPRLRD